LSTGEKASIIYSAEFCEILRISKKRNPSASAELKEYPEKMKKQNAAIWCALLLVALPIAVLLLVPSPSARIVDVVQPLMESEEIDYWNPDIFFLTKYGLTAAISVLCGLVLTIDAEIQEMVEKAMRECIEVNQAQSVICLVSDVKTGAILAMCMNPCYDPNDPPRNDAETLTELMRLTAISDVYEPGSTFKILTAASALDSGGTTPQDSFYCSAKITVDGDTIRCWGRPHGAETMADGLKNSCNPVFVELALRMGTDTFYRYLTAFGLGKKTGIDLPGESPGILITSRNVKRVDLARIGFGQSVALTPIQMMMAANSVINGGKLMKPYIVSEIQTPDGETLERFHPTVMAAPIRPETSDTMRLLLERVVSEGGGKNAAIAGYRLGGETRTAPG